MPAIAMARDRSAPSEADVDRALGQLEPQMVVGRPGEGDAETPHGRVVGASRCTGVIGRAEHLDVECVSRSISTTSATATSR